MLIAAALAGAVVGAQPARRRSGRRRSRPPTPPSRPSGAGRARPVPRARRQLRRLPHRARRRALRGRHRHRHAFRHRLRVEPHARSRDRHRRLDRLAFLARHAQRPLARRPPALSGLPLSELHPHHARGFGCDLRLAADAGAGRAAQHARTRCAFPTTRRRRSPSGARCSSSRGTHEPDAGRSAEWNRGAYLVNGLGHCNACHSGRNLFGATSGTLELSGGLIPMQNWYAPSLAAPRRGGRRRLGHARRRRPARQRRLAARLGDGADGRSGLSQHAAPVGAGSAGDRGVPQGPAAGRRRRRAAAALVGRRAATRRCSRRARSTRRSAPVATATRAKARPAPIRRSRAIAR